MNFAQSDPQKRASDGGADGADQPGSERAFVEVFEGVAALEDHQVLRDDEENDEDHQRRRQEEQEEGEEDEVVEFHLLFRDQVRRVVYTMYTFYTSMAENEKRLTEGPTNRARRLKAVLQHYSTRLDLLVPDGGVLVVDSRVLFERFTNFIFALGNFILCVFIFPTNSVERLRPALQLLGGVF